MVDPIGLKPSAAIDRRLAPVANVAAVQVTQPAVPDAGRANPSTLRALAQPLAATPPVDADRVATIRRALEEGRFSLTPSTIADRLIDLKREWTPHEST